MLTLSRRVGEQVVIGGNIVITVKSLSEKKVSISIDAPKEILILRKELEKRNA